MSRILLLQCAFIALLMASSVPALAQSVVEREVGHLLLYIETSGCTFIRNGTEHPSREAKEHIEMKYNHVRRRVKTAEDFIRFAASQSSLSGKPYRVRCDGKEMLTAKWLGEELGRFREAESP